MSNTVPANCQVVNMQQTSGDYSTHQLTEAVGDMIPNLVKKPMGAKAW